jgi:hypothetical protein
MRLGAGEIGRTLPPVFAWWREFAARYVGMLCSGAQPVAPSQSDLASLVLTAPIMPGAEYVTPDTLLALWAELDAAFSESVAAAGTDIQTFLKELNPAWNLVGRVHFNLAENKRDPEQPFAFMATYSTRLSAQAKAQHVPLGQALREYSGAAKRNQLLSLLVPVQRAAETCDWLKSMVDSGEIFHPLRWSAGDAARFLADVPELENAGVVVRMPATWHAKRPPRPQVTATVGTRAPAGIGLDALLDFHVAMTLDGEPLGNAEINALLAGTDTLVLLRGQWVEIDRERLERALRQFRDAEALAKREGITFTEAMRLLAGVGSADGDKEADRTEWVARDGGTLARPKTASVARVGWRARRSGFGSERRLTPLSESRRAMDAIAVRTWVGCMPRGRYGARQNDPGVVFAPVAGRETSGETTEFIGRACVVARELGPLQ